MSDLQPGVQRNAQIDAAASSNGAAPAVVRCSSCRADVPAGDYCPQCHRFLPANGEGQRFQPLNEAALKHGLRRWETTRRMPEDLRLSVEEFRADVISDQGGLDGLSAIRAGLIRVLVNVEATSRLAMNAIVKHGTDTPTGQRAHDRLLASADRYMRLAQLLGIDRKPKDVQTLDAYLATYADARQGAQDAPPSTALSTHTGTGQDAPDAHGGGPVASAEDAAS